MSIKIFALDDCTWWAAETADEAVDDYTKETGQPVVDEYPEELDDEAMGGHTFHDSEFNNDSEREWTFRDELDAQVAAGQTFPKMFATTEY